MAKPPRQLTHKQGECIGCAYCVETAPDYFGMGEDGLAFLWTPTGQVGPLTLARAEAADLAALQQAAEGCPVDIIALQ